MSRGDALFTGLGGVFARRLVLPSLGVVAGKNRRAEQWDALGAKFVRSLWLARYDALEAFYVSVADHDDWRGCIPS